MYEENNRIAGSIIVDKIQPIEYTKIVWGQTFTNDEVMVIHLLIVRPSKAGKGIATASMNVGSAIEHSGHLFLEKCYKQTSACCFLLFVNISQADIHTLLDYCYSFCGIDFFHHSILK